MNVPRPNVKLVVLVDVIFLLTNALPLILLYLPINPGNLTISTFAIPTFAIPTLAISIILERLPRS